MKNATILFVLLLGIFTSQGQTATSITNLQTPLIDETSGVIFYNNKLITHTDSGGEAKLYEVSTTNGVVTRTVTINNATNSDWEDIAQDATHIYIGDIGNNGGNRTDLKIYKISKVDYDGTDNTATAEVINYSYSNQTDFTVNVNNNNWDAEGMISYGDKLLIFTKNWANNMVNVYSIPKTTTQTHSAVLESTYNTNGLITGAEISTDGNVIFLSGYSSSAAPFMFTIHNIPANSLNIFSGTVSPKIQNIVPLGNQIEALALYEVTPTQYKLYLTNEKFVTFVGPIPFNFPAKLWNINLDTSTLGISAEATDFDVYAYPNPVNNQLKFSKTVDKLVIYDSAGRVVESHKSINEISTENLIPGIYTIQIEVNESVFTKKIVKK